MSDIIKKTDIPFTQIPNAVLVDKNISAKAKGFYCYLFSKPDGWQFYQDLVEKELKESYKAFKSGIIELVENGYINRHQHNQNGKFGGMIYEFLPVDRKPILPMAQNGEYAKRGQHSNTDYLSNTEYNIYNNPPIVPQGTCQFCPDGNKNNQDKFFSGSASVNEQQTNDGATALTNNDLDNKFEELWKIYTPYETPDGRSVGKGAKKTAKDKFVKTVAKGTDPDDIIQGTRLYIADCHRRKSLTKNVPTFLNQEQWKDYLDQTDELPIPVMPMGLMFRNADLQNTDPETYMDLLRTEWKNWSEYAPNWVPVEKTPEMALELAKRVLSSKYTIAFSNSILDTKFWAQHRFEVQFLLGRVRWLGILFGALGKHIPLTE